MTQNQLLLKQTEIAYEWSNKLLSSVNYQNWDSLAAGIDCNLSWQAGHLIVSTYYHTIMTTVGHVPELIEELDLRGYTKLCNYDTFAIDMVGKTNPKVVFGHLKDMQQYSLKIIASLSDKELQTFVKPTTVPHPVAKTKFEAVDWNIKHTMWHCGQISVIKRIIDKPYDYGIKKPSNKGQ